MSTLTLNCLVKEPALGDQDHFKIIIDTNKNGYDLKKLIWENINILDVDICTWKVKISFNEKENLQPENVEGIEIKDESSVGDIFNKQVEDDIYILVQVYYMCKTCGNNLPYPGTTSVMHKEYAEPLGERELQSVQDPELFGKLMKVRTAFLNKLKKEGKEPIALIVPGIVNNKPAIIADFPNETVQTPLPAMFEGYPVLTKYRMVKPASNPRVMHKEEYAEPLGERELQSVQDPELFVKLMKVRTAFLNKLKKEGKEPMALIGPGIVNNKPAIIAVFPNETVQTPLPAMFEGYPVLTKYGMVKPASNPRAYHKILKPGISIGRSEAQNAFTLGAFFQTKDAKKFILTAGHAVGEVCNIIVQPGRYENDPNTSSCAKVTCKFSGLNESYNIIDYTFCEVNDCGRVSVVDPNKPFGSETVIRNCKGSISNDNDSMSYTHKFGRSSFLTKGVAIDCMAEFYTDEFGGILKVSALLVSSIDRPFGELGDSGSPVYDDNGQLWGIYYGFEHPYHFIIPIHLILNDVQKRFKVDFTLIN